MLVDTWGVCGGAWASICGCGETGGYCAWGLAPRVDLAACCVAWVVLSTSGTI